MSNHLFALLVLLAAVSVAADDKLPADARADRVIVMKKDRTLTLMNRDKVLKVYKVALGGDPVGPKRMEGDHRTPEGTYILDRRNSKSKYYRSIHISYPSVEDRERAHNLGVSPGGDVMVNGLPSGFGWLGASHRAQDWTDGCIAVTDQEMDEIWNAVPDGTPIEIKP